MYSSIGDGFSKIMAAEGVKGFSLVSPNSQLLPKIASLVSEFALPKQIHPQAS